MKLTSLRMRGGLGRYALRATLLGTSLFLISSQAQQIKWGLTITNINNPITPTIVTNADGSIAITAGGGDTYGAPDSFTYAYQQVTGDFDIRVQIVNVTATDPLLQDSPKGSLMVRASLDPNSDDFQINALPLAPSGRNGQIETIGRITGPSPGNDTDDLPGRGLNYGPGNGVTEPFQGDTTDHGYCTYPDLWLRVQRQGELPGHHQHYRRALGLGVQPGEHQWLATAGDHSCRHQFPQDPLCRPKHRGPQ